MSKIEVGKYFKIPINDFKIHGFDFTKSIRIEFLRDYEEDLNYELEIWGKYQIKRYGKEYKFSRNEIDGYKCLLDFSDEIIKTCEADKNGNFWLETKEGNSIVIEDGEYENWQFKIHKRLPKFKTKVQLIGGVGQTTLFNG